MVHDSISRYGLFLLLFGSLCLACQPSNPRERRTVATQDILAQIGDRVITKKDFQAALMQMSPYIRTQYNSWERRKQLLLQLVEFEVLLLEAKKQKMEQTAEVELLRRRIMVQTLLNRVVQKVRPMDISDAEIRGHWQRHRQRFSQSFLQEKESIRSVLLQQKQTMLYDQYLVGLRKRYPVVIDQNLLREVPSLAAKASVPPKQPTPSSPLGSSQPVQRNTSVHPTPIRTWAPSSQASSTPATVPSSLPGGKIR